MPPETAAILARIGAALAVGLGLTFFLAWALPRWFRLPGWTFSSVAWVGVLAFALAQFSETRPAAGWIGENVLRPVLMLAVIVLVSSLLATWMARGLEFYFDQLERVRGAGGEGLARWKARMYMVRQAIVVLVRGAIFVAGALIYLGTLHINISALLTGAGIFGVAVGLAAQDILKDFGAGIYIVLEDQFGVDDLISTQGQEGWVEGFTLRATRLRDAEGSVTTIPNAMVRIVKNLSRSGFYADVKVTVAGGADLSRALEEMRAVAVALQEEWPDRLAGPPRWVGLEDLSEDKAVLRMLVPVTSADNQPVVRREILLRLGQRLATHRSDRAG